jgi:prephenate dehydrogenase
MGGSLGLAARSKGLASPVVGFDIDPRALELALERGAVDESASDPAEAVSGADLVFLSTPLRVIVEVFEEIAPALTPGMLVTDVGSTKSRVVREVGSRVPRGVHFIGGHPIAGSEHEGISAADEDLYRGAYWILTPTDETDPAAYGRLVRFIGGLDARVLALPADRHDEAMALMSHLPQFVASVLMEFAADAMKGEPGLPFAAGGGFRDMTRVASSSPDMWLGILRDNREAALDALDGFRDSLSQARGLLAGEDWEGLGELLAAAQAARRSMPEKPGVRVGDLVEVDVEIPDRPGALAGITTAVGESGVNIEDLHIVHSAEGARGTVRLLVEGRDAAARAEDSLTSHGYRASVRESE